MYERIFIALIFLASCIFGIAGAGLYTRSRKQAQDIKGVLLGFFLMMVIALFGVWATHFLIFRIEYDSKGHTLALGGIRYNSPYFLGKEKGTHARLYPWVACSRESAYNCTQANWEGIDGPPLPHLAV